MATRIDAVTSREKLKPRRECCWQRVRKGCFFGYRKRTSAGHGAWAARARDEDAGTKQLFKPLGEFGELPKLTPAQFETWRKSLRDLPTRSGGNRGKQRSDSTLNAT